MNCDEKEIIKDIAARRGAPTKESAFKKISPSNKYVLIGGALLLSVVLIVIYSLSKPGTLKRKNLSSDNRLIARLMPKDEITPDYIESLGAEDLRRTPRKTDKKDAEKNKNNADAKHKPSVQSMILYTSEALARRLGTLGVPMGTELTAVLEKTVIADDRAVPVIAKITQAYRKNGKSIIPRNARLFGSTQGMVENRINVKFSKIVFPNGKEYPFSGIALDSNGAGGIPGKLKRKRGRRGAGVLSSALIGASGVFAPVGGGFSDTAVRGAHRGAQRELRRDSRYYQRTEAVPIVTIRAKTPLTILVDKAV